MVGGPGVGGIQIICCGKSTGGGVSADEQKSTGNTSNSISPPPQESHYGDPHIDGAAWHRCCSYGAGSPRSI